MNKDFSIEASIEKIHNPKTKEYFNEVYQTFVNENYRSSIVMLYSVLICDLIFKLKDLRDLYKDSMAGNILQNVEKLQSKKPTSPDWETLLINNIKTNMTLLEASDIVTIETLRKYRHLSAHPILTNTDLLYSPDKDTVRSLIRNILKGVLTHPPFFSNKIFDTFLNDLADIKDKITDIEDLKKYLTSRYLKQIKESVYQKIFRSLWKIVFITFDENSENNRDINYNALQVLLEYKEDLCVEMIKLEPIYYSNISDNKSLDNLTLTLAQFPKVYANLKNDIQILLSKHINQNQNLKLIAWFLTDSVKKHIQILKTIDFECLQIKYILILKNLSIQDSCYSDFIDFIIDYFGNSSNFASTLDRYENALSTILDDINIEQFKKILEKSDKNNQIYNRRGMEQLFEKIIEERFNNQINKSDYKKLFYDPSSVFDNS